jgi:hypothetical protein
MNELLEGELRRLAAGDPALRAAGLRLGEAHATLAREIGRSADETASYEITSDDEGLPFAAQRVFAVRIGREPWSHVLTGRTFTFGPVTGVIRRLGLECATERRRVVYQVGMEWTLPPSARDCTLTVQGKHDTIFTLYEFPQRAVDVAR